MKHRITLDLDEEMLRAVDGGAGLVGESRAKFIESSLRSRLAALERKRVDSAFAAMAEDADRAREALSLETELEGATDAAWRSIDRAEARSAAHATERAPASKRRRRAKR